MDIEYLKMLLIITQLTIAVIYDVRYYKVKNEINLLFAIAGITYNVFANEQSDFLIVILGLIIPFVILLPLYILNMLGAGDIKLICSIGALIGLGDILLSIAFSFIFGFIVALTIMIFRKNFIYRLRKLYTYLKGCFLNMSIMPYDELNENNDGKMHFTIPIALGTIMVNIF